MTQEEKAKAYDEVLEKIQPLYEQAKSDDNPIWSIYEYLFSQLAESEDERIRKFLIDYFEFIKSTLSDGIWKGFQIEEILAWLEKQKERKPIKMEVYEIGKGTTIYGQYYKCKKDYKEGKGNCWYIKDVIYYCSRDGYLTDQNGASWSCTPEWFNEYIYSNKELADKEKNDFVSGQFIQCKLSFDGFKEGEHYWLEYIGDDMYVGRSDNILNQKFHITPRQLYTLFSQKLEENEKERLPVEEEILSKLPDYTTNLTPYIEQKPAEWDALQADFRSINEAFENGKKEVVEHPERYGLCKPAEWSKEDERKFLEIRCLIGNYRTGNDEYELYSWIDKIKDRVQPQPKQEWSEEDEQYLLVCKNALNKYQCSDHWDANIISKWLENRLKSLRPQPKQEWTETDEGYLIRVINIVASDFGEDSDTVKWLKSLRLQAKEQVLPSLSEKEIVCLKRTLDYLRKEHCRYGGRDFTNEIAVLEYLITHPTLVYSSQPHWKPSEEQTNALEECGECKRCIKELREQLKKS